MKRKIWLLALLATVSQSRAAFAGGVGCEILMEYPKLHQAVVRQSVEEIQTVGMGFAQAMMSELASCRRGQCYFGAQEVPRVEKMVEALQHLVDADSVPYMRKYYADLSREMIGLCRLVRWWQDMWVLYDCTDVKRGQWVQRTHETMTIPYNGNHCGPVLWTSR